MGRFGWNEDPAIDFCVEVDCIEGDFADVRAGYGGDDALLDRVLKAMMFRVGGNERAVAAKDRLREIEKALHEWRAVERGMKR